MAVTGTETAVLVLCTGGAPSACSSAGLTRVRSATDCVVSLDVISWLGTVVAVAVVAVPGSSGRLACTLGIGPIRMGSRSLRTTNGLPRVTGDGFHGSQTMAFKRVVSQRRLSTLRFNARLRPLPFGVPIKCSLVLPSRPNQTPSSHADSNLLTSAPDRLHATALQRVRLGFVSNLLVCCCC